MRYHEITPGAELARYIKCYWFLSGAAEPAPDEAQPILPDGCMELVLNLGDAFQRSLAGSWERQPLSMIVGQTSGPVVVGPTGKIDLIGVRFHPWGARSFIDLPLALLRDRIPALDEVSAGLARLARDHDSALRGCRTVSSLERILLRALRRPAPSTDKVENAARLMTLARGAVIVADVAREVSLTGRQLERRFKEEIGVGPKQLCRILRFQNALAASHREPRPNWARIAAESGYFDQTHLVRDFRQFAGHTPASLQLDETSLTFLSVTAEAGQARV